MKLFVGLGNPGAQYARHRHNVGYVALDKIASEHSLGPWRKRFQGETTEGILGGERVVLLKPTTYMNDSGRSVGEAARFLKIDVGDIYVFHDEIDLAPAKLKVKVGGGNAGHNGLRSITAHMGNEYNRVRIGVGHPGVKDAVAHYVLHDFAKVEYAWLDPLLDAMAEAALSSPRATAPVSCRKLPSRRAMAMRLRSASRHRRRSLSAPRATRIRRGSVSQSALVRSPRTSRSGSPAAATRSKPGPIVRHPAPARGAQIAPPAQRLGDSDEPRPRARIGSHRYRSDAWGGAVLAQGPVTASAAVQEPPASTPPSTTNAPASCSKRARRTTPYLSST